MLRDRDDAAPPEQPLPIEAIRHEERLSEKVAKELEALVLSGVLKQGQKLPPERELAAMFGVSRTVIREAYQVLAAKGLLSSHNGAGAIVRGPGTDSVTEALGLLVRSRADGFEIANLHEARRVLEVAIVARAAERATEEDIADLEDCVARLEGVVGEEAAELDVDFHRALAVATHNPIFIILLESIGSLLLEVRRLALQDAKNVRKALHHHASILDKVKARDPEQARAAMWAHIDEAVDTMDSVLRTRGSSQTLFRAPPRPPLN